MKKSTIIVKRTLALFLVVLMSIESFGAVVSDNDGSAFITKAEFDSLKNNFQSQIDQYNTSIDSKIDGAIASYLAGINLTKQQTKSIIYNDWTDVSMISGSLQNEYIVPNIDINFMFGMLMLESSDIGGTSEQYQAVTHAVRGTYANDWTSVDTCHRNVVASDGATYATYGKFYWTGRALRWCDVYNISRCVDWSHPTKYWYGLDRPDMYTQNITLRDFSTFVGLNAWYDSWENVRSAVWKITYLNQTKNKSSGAIVRSDTYTFSATQLRDQWSPKVELAYKDGKQYDYTHIVAYDGDDEWRVAHKDWTQLLSTDTKSTITPKTVHEAMTINAKGRYGGWAFHTGATAKADVPRGIADMPTQFTKSEATKFPTLGLIPRAVTADEIYQVDKDLTVDVTDKISVKKEKETLEKGFALLGGEEGAEIIWEPTFSYTHVHNSADTYVDNTHEVDIYLSSGPFSNKVNTSNAIQVTVDDGTTKENYATTTNRKCKIKFEMPKTGIVYVKWVPHNETTYLNSDWIITLDTKNCNSYQYTAKS